MIAFFNAHEAKPVLLKWNEQCTIRLMRPFFIICNSNVIYSISLLYHAFLIVSSMSKSYGLTHYNVKAKASSCSFKI